MEGFDFPLGVYPVDKMQPHEGYTVMFEAADEPGEGGLSMGSGMGSGMGRGNELSDGLGVDDNDDDDDDDDDGDEADDTVDEISPWPDRYVWDIVVKSSRVESLTRSLFSMFGGRLYPIVDVLGNDPYREIDPYIAYDLVGQDRFLDYVRRYKSFLYEDGMVGFGAMSEEPFLYVFVDEHKIVTVRAQADMKDRIESLLHAFDLQTVEALAGADSAIHEHRGVLDCPPERPDLLTSDEIIEELRDAWALHLNIDPRSNLDPEARELGITGWRVIVRLVDDRGDVRYREVMLTAANLMNAEDLAADDAITEDSSDRLKAEQQDKPAAAKAAKPPTRKRGGAAPSGLKFQGEPVNPDDLADALSMSDDDGDSPSGGVDMISTDRVRPDDFARTLKELGIIDPNMQRETVYFSRWLD